MTQNGVWVVTIAWNERSTIETLIYRVRTVLRGIPHEVIVVDDDCPDGTIDIARRLADVAVTKKEKVKQWACSMECKPQRLLIAHNIIQLNLNHRLQLDST